MKLKTVAIGLAAGGSLLAGASSASAVDIQVLIPDFGPLASGEVHVFQFNLSNTLPITGFSFEGHWDTTGGTWASDTNLHIMGPGGDTWAVGGFGSPSDEDWDFQGGGSDPTGFYSHGPSAGIAGWDGDGLWTLTFTQDFGTLNLFSQGVLTIHQIPAPGALALLGVAGLIGVGRRRRE